MLHNTRITIPTCPWFLKWDVITFGYLLEAKGITVISTANTVTEGMHTTSREQRRSRTSLPFICFELSLKPSLKSQIRGERRLELPWIVFKVEIHLWTLHLYASDIMRALSQILTVEKSAFPNAMSHKPSEGGVAFLGSEASAAAACCSRLSSEIAVLFLPREFDGFGSSTIERDTVLIALEGSKAFELWLWVIFCWKTCVSTWLVNSRAGLYSMLGPSIWKTTLHPNLTSVFYHAVRLTGHSIREASFWNRQSK